MICHNARSDSEQCKELVIVCCHATFWGSDIWDEQDWVLQPFQRSDSTTGKPGEHRTFIDHMSAGVQLLESELEAYLVFSGGQTQNERSITEAKSYSNVFLSPYAPITFTNYDEQSAIHTRHQERWASIRSRFDCEESATDSYQNLLFSIVTFQRRWGRYPERITVITHAFKERRFLELHAKAIKWPASKIRVLGINPPFALPELAETERNERESGYGPFVSDPYGAVPPLSEKRRARNWDRKDVLPLLSKDLEDEVQNLLAWDGGADGRTTFPGKLPWEDP